MNSFFSNRNQVYPVLRDGQAAVEKHFTDMTDWQWEAALYAVLEGRLPLPTVLDSAPGVLVTAYEPAFGIFCGANPMAGWSAWTWKIIGRTLFQPVEPGLLPGCETTAPKGLP